MPKTIHDMSGAGWSAYDDALCGREYEKALERIDAQRARLFTLSEICIVGGGVLLVFASILLAIAWA